MVARNATRPTRRRGRARSFFERSAKKGGRKSARRNREEEEEEDEEEEPNVFVFSLLSCLPLSTTTLLDKQNRSALHFASGYGELDCVRVLVKAGVKIDAGERPFFHFFFSLLLSPRNTTASGDLHFLLTFFFFFFFFSLSLSMLLFSGDGNGNTALHYAAGYNQPECVMELLAAGADPSKKNNEGKSAALVAKLNGSDEIAEMLGGDDYDGEEAEKDAEKKEEEKKGEDEPEEKK
jgi:hypothetical protein